MTFIVKKTDLKRAKRVISTFPECCHGNVYYLNETVVTVLDFKSRGLLFAIVFSSQFFTKT